MYSKQKGKKRTYVFFAKIEPNGVENTVYLSAYGHTASPLLKKYVEDQRADNEELFAKWDGSVQKAKSQAGFSATHDAEELDGDYVYISAFQNGIGIPPEDETAQKKRTDNS